MDLRQESCNWVLAANLMTLLNQELVPGSVMDFSIRAPLRPKDLESDFLQTLSAQPRRQVLDAQLAGDPERARELCEKVLVSLRALLDRISKRP